MRKTSTVFLLYRHSNFRALKAYQDLADFYYIRSNRIDRALPVATLAAVISITRMTEVLRQKDLDYVYRDLTDLFDRFAVTRDLSAWASENRMWLSFTILARVMRAAGMREQSLSLWNALEAHCPDPDVVRMAEIAIRNP
jgi:hypothetical protein